MHCIDMWSPMLLQVHTRLLSFLGDALTAVSSSGEKLSDMEASILIPCLLEKSGHPRFKPQYAEIIGQISHMYSRQRYSKIHSLVVYGLIWCAL